MDITQMDIRFGALRLAFVHWTTVHLHTLGIHCHLLVQMDTPCRDQPAQPVLRVGVAADMHGVPSFLCVLHDSVRVCVCAPVPE